MNITVKCPRCRKIVVPDMIQIPEGVRIKCPDCKIIILELKNENTTQKESKNS